MAPIKSYRFWFAVLAMLVLAAGGLSVTPASAQAGLAATLSVDAQEVTVGDVIPLTLSVTHPAGWRVILPTLDQQWGDFEVRGQTAPDIISNADGTQTTRQFIQVARMRPGDTQTPALTLSVADDQGSLTSLEVPPVAVSVRSVLVAGDTTLRDIKPQAELVTEGRPYWPLVTAGLLGAAAVTFYSVQRWRRRKPVDRRTPRQRTLDNLQTLAAQAPQTELQVKVYCASLAGYLRDYLATVTPLAARDLTTREIARQLQGGEFPPEWRSQVVEVLQVCDNVKFANHTLELPAIQALNSAARQLVEQYPPLPAPEPKGRAAKKSTPAGTSAAAAQ